MNSEDLRDQQIEKYIHQQMSDDERLRFEESMKNDAYLGIEVKEQQQLFSMYDKELLDFKKKLDESLAEQGRKEKPKRVFHLRENIRYVLSVAAALFFVIALFFFYPRPVNYRQLAMNAARNDFGNLRGSKNYLDSLFAIANYQAFIIASNEVILNPSNTGDKIKLRVNLTCAYLLSNNIEEANAQLRMFNSQEQNDCSVRYVSALILLAEGNKDAAEEKLESLTSDQCYPYDGDTKAEFLLKRIK